MSCIALIFCTNKNIISNHGVDVTIFEKCHHNIIYGKINTRVLLPPVYIREAWDYSKAKIENINKAISNFNWTRAFENRSVNKKVELLNETLLNIYQNYIPNKEIECGYCPPQWMADITKKHLKEISEATKLLYKIGQRKSNTEKSIGKSYWMY